MAYEGRCHCGAVAFRVDGDLPTEAIECNCSHCRRKGLLLSFVPEEAFTLTQGEEVLADYLFNAHAITHRFCTKCGCQSFAIGKGKDGQSTAAINLRSVPGINLDTLTRKPFDGASA